VRFTSTIEKKFKSIVLFLARKCGIDLYLRKKNYHYVPDIFGKSSAKMFDIRDDDFFFNTANMVIKKQKTFLYYDRLYTIYQSLLNLSKIAENHHQLTSMVEVGVHKGGSSYFIASIVQKLFGKVNLYCVDTFQGHSKKDLAGSNYDVHRPSWFSDTTYEDVCTYLNDFDFVHVIQGRVQDCENLFSDKSFCFVHLDVDIYRPMLFSLNLFYPLLTRGGIFIIDDFGFKTCPGVREAVKYFLENHQHSLYKFELQTGQCILMKMK
jgi:O-methyltransferase